MRALAYQLPGLLDIGSLDVLSIEVHVQMSVSLPNKFHWRRAFNHWFLLVRSQLTLLVHFGLIIFKCNVTFRQRIRFDLDHLLNDLLSIDSICANIDFIIACIINELVLDACLSIINALSEQAIKGALIIPLPLCVQLF